MCFYWKILEMPPMLATHPAEASAPQLPPQPYPEQPSIHHYFFLLPPACWSDLPRSIYSIWPRKPLVAALASSGTLYPRQSAAIGVCCCSQWSIHHCWFNRALLAANIKRPSSHADVIPAEPHRRCNHGVRRLRSRGRFCNQGARQWCNNDRCFNGWSQHLLCSCFEAGRWRIIIWDGCSLRTLGASGL